MAKYTEVENAKIGILMGSASDWPTMKRASEMLNSFDVAHECNALSAHRNADVLRKYLENAEDRGIELFICAAGGAAHLAGVVAAHTEKPVLGCPMQAWSLDGLDSLLSTVQMPKGIPVATFAIGSAGATNAALFAIQMLSMSDSGLLERFSAFRKEQAEKVTSLD
jgi:5-(carboxyamino)imidazole ribonucleotide mutase